MTDRAAPQPLGILGGTFDPVHIGHLRLAEEARVTLGLAEVLWIPAGQPPHRAAPCSAAEHRLAMTRLAIADSPTFVLDDSEVHTAAPSYSVLTLTRLRELHGLQRPLVLLMGADAFLGLECWHRWRELFDLVHLGVATRPGSTLAPAIMTPQLAAEFSGRRCEDAAVLRTTGAGRILPFAITPLDVSATQIRHMLATGGSARYLLPAPVLDYIAKHQLYRA